MATLLIIGICLYLYGFVRVFVVYLAILATVASLACTMVAGAGLSALWWSEEVRHFQIVGDLWVDQFVHRDGFTLAQGVWIPVILVFDCIRISAMFVWQIPNPFSIGAACLWLWMMVHLWFVIVLRVFLPNIAHGLMTMKHAYIEIPKLYRNARNDREREEMKNKDK